MVKTIPKELKNPSSEEKLNSKTKTKLEARKKLKEIALNSEFDKKKYTFAEYLGIKRKNDKELDKTMLEANLDTESAASLTKFLSTKESDSPSKNSEKEKNFLDKNFIDKNYLNFDNEEDKKSQISFKEELPLEGKTIVVTGE